MSDKTIYITLTDANFRKEVLESTLPIVVPIRADWSGVCHMMSPVIKQLIIDCNGQIRLGKLDIDSNKRVVKKYGIGELPSFLFFKRARS